MSGQRRGARLVVSPDGLENFHPWPRLLMSDSDWIRTPFLVSARIQYRSATVHTPFLPANIPVLHSILVSRIRICFSTCTRGRSGNVERLRIFPGIRDSSQQLARPPIMCQCDCRAEALVAMHLRVADDTPRTPMNLSVTSSCLRCAKCRAPPNCWTSSSNLSSRLGV